MFDRINVSPGLGFVNATITENRAPTDESVRLLMEMEQAARQKVIESTVVSDTAFECKIMKSKDFESSQDVYIVIYKLNNIKRSVNIKIDIWKQLSPTEIAVAIRDKVAEDISNEMLKVAFQKVEKW